ncbi:hypothetical protein DKY63_10510 [Pseudomonas putida]|uniref:Uncharacterized protein n=1 Tax=Pseudomonas putida TaxID=303 RepID=A0A2Z4RGY2_PSEPU|nr:hypothetical protein DKY63_10510 [Pseudomonas putida]
MRGFFCLRNPVGASLLAMVVNDNAGCLIPRGDLKFIASRLAPTVGWRVFAVSSRLTGRTERHPSPAPQNCQL